MAGPAFKSGVMLPHPVLHPEVAPTALASLGKVGGKAVALRTAARGAIQAALVGDPGETMLPSPTRPTAPATWCWRPADSPGRRPRRRRRRQST